MKYKLTHTTSYAYSEPVAVSHNQVHLMPRSLDRQQCHHYDLLIGPTPTNRERRVDYFGNWVEYFAIGQVHRKLVVTATSLLEITPRELPACDVAWERIANQLKNAAGGSWGTAAQFTFGSRHIPRAEKFADYARQSFTPQRPIVAAAQDFIYQVFAHFRFDPTATSLSTPVDEVFTRQAGVCQDFAHLAIACLRSIGLAARYVSGYLRTKPPPGQPRLIGADASHAWISLFCGDAGWIDLDPTNNMIPNTDHLTIAWGRDYADVCPVQGAVVGGGEHKMSVSVDVLPGDTFSDSENSVAS